jgi:Sec-independent protein translocase protein TatA
LISELFVIAGIALVMIPPKKWPALIHHLHQALRFLEAIQQKARHFWCTQLAHYELQHNQEKAAKAKRRH